jgi:heat-inducible transcriptional repressor
MLRELGDRKRTILQAIVQTYILTGRPVGSRAISERYDLGISAATIRNEMGALERLGLIYQPHTSAGRVPTDLAYRYYVSLLMEQPHPTDKDTEAIERLFNARSREIDGLLREVSVLLSKLTRTTAMVFAPLTPIDTIRNLDMLRLGSHRVMLIVITAEGEIGRRLLTLNSSVSTDNIERVLKFLNGELKGKGMAAIDREAVTARARFGEAGMELLETALDSILEYLGSMEERIFIGGTANIVREMDGAGAEWVESLLEALEKQYFILDLLKDLIREKQLTVRIGEENRARELQRCSVIGMSYPVAPGLLGSLGVVGSTSMDYARTITMVQYMAENLGRRLLGPGD